MKKASPPARRLL